MFGNKLPSEVRNSSSLNGFKNGLEKFKNKSLCESAFEALGKLYEFSVIYFGVMDGVAAFQRVIDQLLEKEKLRGTFSYQDNITMTGETQKDHGMNGPLGHGYWLNNMV